VIGQNFLSPKGGTVSQRALVIALIVAGVAFIAGAAPSANAQGPGAFGAPYVDNQWHTIAPNATQWYVFNRPDDRTSVTLTLVNGVALGLAFNVFAPGKTDQPIGRGTASQVSCNGAKCASADLTWTGGASSPGLYSVQVINTRPIATTYLLTLTGLSIVPAPSYPYSYSPHGVPYPPPYGQPYYYTPPYQPPYGSPYAPPYYGPGYIPPYRPACPPGYYYWPRNRIPWYCR
jgi:hypothetical protein